jgi:prolipoprotein diacylglyceryltransferase
VYAIIGRGLILAAIWPGQHDQDKLPGMIFFTFAALTAGWQLFITGFRGDSELILSGLRSAQIISWLILAAACWGIHSVYQRHRRIDGS